jgi:hypothetical protein
MNRFPASHFDPRGRFIWNDYQQERPFRLSHPALLATHC